MFKGHTKTRRFLSPDFAEEFVARSASNREEMLVSEMQAAGAPFTALPSRSAASAS